MKSSVLLLILSSFSNCHALGWQEHNRHLSNSKQYAYLVSHISDKDDWCITVLSGGDVGFKPCDYKNAPSNQLWMYNAGSKKFASKIHSNRCMIVNYGKKLGSGVHIRLDDCNEKTELNMFEHNGGSDKIRVHKDNSLCITNSGNHANSGDITNVQKCENKGKFVFTYKLEERSDEPAKEYFGLNDDGYPVTGCLLVKNVMPKANQPLILDDCDLVHGWRYDKDGLFHSELDDDMCMQAGKKGVMPGSGTKMLLYPCDKTNKQQQFNYDYYITYRYDEKLCVGIQGATSNVGSDPIVLKGCNKVGVGWSVDR